MPPSTSAATRGGRPYMNSARVAALLFFVSLAAGCVNNAAVIASGNRNIPYVKQFRQLFPHCHCSLGYDPGAPVLWYSETTFYRRYELTMRLQVKLNPAQNAVVKWGRPRFWLVEVKKVSKREIDYRPGGEVDFRLKRWKRLVRAHGHFKKIGIHLIKNRPVKNFSEEEKRIFR